MKFTVFNEKSQDVTEFFEDLWEETIRPQLPSDEFIDQQIKNSGSLCRFRIISNALALIKGALLYAVSGMSFAVLSSATHALGIAKMSDTAWRKRILKLAPFLEILLTFLLTRIVKASLFPIDNIPNVYLIDATNIRLQGKEQYLERLHVRYSANFNVVDQVKVTDKHTAESLCHFSMKPGDISIADTAYATAKNYAYAVEQKSDVILRMNPQNFSLYNMSGERIKYEKYLKKFKKGSKEVSCYVRTDDGKQYPARLIIEALPKDQAKEAQKRKIKEAKKDGREIRPETLRNAKYVFLLTSLDETKYGRNTILELYRIRWQIELLFKRIKQMCEIKTIRVASPKYARVMSYLWLIVWIITEKKAILMQNILERRHNDKLKRISLWTLFEMSYRFIKYVIELGYPIMMWLQGSIESLEKLADHKRKKRINQNSQTKPKLLEILPLSSLAELLGLI